MLIPDVGQIHIFVLKITPVVHGSSWNAMCKGGSSELHISQVIFLILIQGFQSVKKLLGT